MPNSEAVRWIALGIGAVAFVGIAIAIAWSIRQRRIPPDVLERRRRDMIHGKGKIGDGEILDVDGDVITYSYSVGGVEYTVAQDAAAVASRLPGDRMVIVGPASVRFDPANPPNSIVVCEQWTGLRPRG